MDASACSNSPSANAMMTANKFEKEFVLIQSHILCEEQSDKPFSDDAKSYYRLFAGVMFNFELRKLFERISRELRNLLQS